MAIQVALENLWFLVPSPWPVGLPWPPSPRLRVGCRRQTAGGGLPVQQHVLVGTLMAALPRPSVWPEYAGPVSLAATHPNPPSAWGRWELTPRRGSAPRTCPAVGPLWVPRQPLLPGLVSLGPQGGRGSWPPSLRPPSCPRPQAPWGFVSPRGPSGSEVSACGSPRGLGTAWPRPTRRGRPGATAPTLGPGLCTRALLFIRAGFPDPSRHLRPRESKVCGAGA